MKVYELFESNNSIENAEHEKSRLEQQLHGIKKEMDDLRNKKGAVLSNGMIAPQYLDHMRRLMAGKKAITDQIKQINANRLAQLELRLWKKEHAEKMSDAEQKAIRQHTAISHGLHQSSHLQHFLGGYAGIANDILKNIDKLTDNRTLPIEIETLADRYDVTPRTIHKWFERPEFLKLRKYMPHMYK